MSVQENTGGLADKRAYEFSIRDIDECVDHLVAVGDVISTEHVVAAFMDALRDPLKIDKDMTFSFRSEGSDDSVASTFTSYGHEYEVHYSAGDDMLERAAVALLLAGSSSVHLSRMTGVSVVQSMCAAAGHAHVDRMSAELVSQTHVAGYTEFAQRHWALLPITEECRVFDFLSDIDHHALVHPVYVSSGILQKQISVADYMRLIMFFERVTDASASRCRRVVVKRRFHGVDAVVGVSRWFEESFGVLPESDALIRYMERPSLPLDSGEAELRRKTVISGSAVVRLLFTATMHRQPQFTAADVSDFVTGVLSNASIASMFRGTAFFSRGGAEWDALDTRRLADMFYMCAYLVHLEEPEEVSSYVTQALGLQVWFTRDMRCLNCGLRSVRDRPLGECCNYASSS